MLKHQQYKPLSLCRPERATLVRRPDRRMESGFLLREANMRAILNNMEAIRASIRAGKFCDPSDSEHIHCPMPTASGGFRFPSGIIGPDGSFGGARRLYEHLAAIPADYRPEKRRSLSDCLKFRRHLEEVRKGLDTPK